MTLSLRTTILGLLSTGPKCQPQLSQAIGSSPRVITKVLTRLVGERQIRFCGFAIDAGLPKECARSPMWGLKDAKLFHAVSAKGERVECSACGSHQVFRLREYSALECRTCNTRFYEGESRPVLEARRRRANGSGQCAGRITIGRGSRWAWVG